MAKTPKAPASKLVIYDMAQGSEEWFKVRAGLPTASVFQTIMATGRDGGESKTREKLLRKLAGEKRTGQPSEDDFRSLAMDRGRALEEEARQSYCRRQKVEIRRIGFARNFEGLKECGASPDGLIGFDGGVEIKTARPDVLIEMLNNPQSMAREHRAQMQGNMLVFERDYWDLTVYAHAEMPAIDIRVRRDESYIREMHEQIEVFNFDLRKMVERLQKLGIAG
jgi:YqaJ-like viral recombinase domain